ncbi:MAG TPA: hypothetical protein IGS17_08095 [Oscillatoriales cyanobacterium M59_W2019_021]|nr:MAG: hypothetical protein D6728_03135 [Cyanobacteria bacterium J055]HIK30962.1 hypothetical protein [Oscillatoriales cyanobacterium M4454_W2019_049]HIK50868.1 hypothetical protein [Oscillatoriales cyanobacterium M59_W2019_021]
MSVLSIEERVAALEAEIVKLRQQIEHPARIATPWWEKISGTFDRDPIYDEAMKLGRQYRRSLQNFKASDVHTRY